MTAGERRPRIGEAIEAYLSLGRRHDPWPGTDERELVRLVGEGAAELKRELDAILDALTDLPDAWTSESLQRVGELATRRARHQHPEFSQELCEEIGRLTTWRWK